MNSMIGMKRGKAMRTAALAGLSALGFGVVMAFTAVEVAEACSRAVYLGPEGRTVTGRTMDWREDMQTHLYLFPRGMTRDGAAGDNSATWTSRYGSVVASIYEGATADGMNEKGLVVNLLYLAESEYPAAEDDRPGVMISAWGQYLLDRYATVAEAVTDLGQRTIKMVPVAAPNGAEGTVHVAISDPSGDSAIFEYLDGELIIHHGREYQVMTNSPRYEQQLALAKYWEQIGGTTMLPGTNRAADRFARASFYINATEQTGDARLATASVFSVMRNVSVPRGITTPDQPNIASTRWRTVSDQKDRVYYYEGTESPSLVWVRLAGLDFSEGSGVRKLKLAGNLDLAGDQTGGFEPAEAFKFLTVEQE